jgi:alpha-tubulin suppressor-like RCC1 family protein
MSSGRSAKWWGDPDAGGSAVFVNRFGDEPDEMGASLPMLDFGSGRSVASIASNTWHACALLDDGLVRCWGYDNFGQLGSPWSSACDGRCQAPMFAEVSAIDLGEGRRATSIAIGENHTSAILDDRSLRCWGHNNNGQLGLGDRDNRGDEPGEMGRTLPAVNLGRDRYATSVAAGRAHTCAILDDGSVKCWGASGSGQLGAGDRRTRGAQRGEMGDDLPAVDLGASRRATAISTKGNFTCALLDDGAVKCWGDNYAGMLGLGDTADRGDEPGEMGDDLPAVDIGSNRRATNLDVGTDHACAILDDGAVKCWGANYAGMLGLGDTANRGDEPGEMGDVLPAVQLGGGRRAMRIVAGAMHTCALLDDASVKCWGNNSSGQLGLGDTEDRGDEPGEMGDALPSVELGF